MRYAFLIILLFKTSFHAYCQDLKNLSFQQIDSILKTLEKSKKYGESLPYLNYVIKKYDKEIGQLDSALMEPFQYSEVAIHHN